MKKKGLAIQYIYLQILPVVLHICKICSYSGRKLQVLLWEHFLWTLFNVCVQAHVILLAGCVPNFRYKGQMPYLNY